MTRVAIGSLMQETNTFVPFPTTLRTFEAFYLHAGLLVSHEEFFCFCPSYWHQIHTIVIARTIQTVLEFSESHWHILNPQSIQ